MCPLSRTDLYFGLFHWERSADGQARLSSRSEAPGAIPDPASGKLIRVASVEARARAICPACQVTGLGGFVSFVSDVRLAYACPSCEQRVAPRGLTHSSSKFGVQRLRSEFPLTCKIHGLRAHTLNFEL
jgi:hypothetical protein